MMKCKWAGDANDEYCKSCDGINMLVDDKSISCTECAGYEEGTEDISNAMTPPVESEPNEEIPFVEEKTVNKESTKKTEKTNEKKKTNNNTTTAEKSKIDEKTLITNKENDDIIKVSQERYAAETTEIAEGVVKVTSLRYTSGATIKKNDNYFKFVAEEEWDVSRINNIDDAREQLWAKLNAQVDSQIEELKNM